MDSIQSPGHQRPPPSLPQTPPSKRASDPTSGLDGIYDFLNSVFTGGPGASLPELPGRLGLDSLWQLQATLPRRTSFGNGNAAVPLPMSSAPPGTAHVPSLQPQMPADASEAPLPEGAPDPDPEPELPGVSVLSPVKTPSATPRCASSDRGLPTCDDKHSLTPTYRIDLVEGEQDETQREPTPGTSSTPSNWRSRRGQPYEVDQDDLLDQHVGYYLRHHADIHARHAIWRNGPGLYLLDGREVTLDWQYATEPGAHGFLVVVDGPLRQPFSDYMEMTDNNAEYDVQSVNRSSLSQIPKNRRMSFHDQHKVYTRLEAMKVAKEQAMVREKHADYVKDGKEAPEDLLSKYKKTIQQKLGQQSSRSQRSYDRTSGHRPPPPPPPPAEYYHDRSPVHPSERLEGGVSRQPPLTPPPAMANVYTTEPMDVDFDFFGGLTQGSCGGRRQPSGNQQQRPVTSATPPPPSHRSGPQSLQWPMGDVMIGTGSQRASPLPASPPSPWHQATDSGYYPAS